VSQQNELAGVLFTLACEWEHFPLSRHDMEDNAMSICLIATQERVEELSKILEKVHVTITFDYEEHANLTMWNLTRVLRAQGLIDTAEKAYLDERIGAHVPVLHDDAQELLEYILDATMAGIAVEPEEGVAETS
jgi:hypothetical protein